jgi:restriction system protein
MRAKIPLLHPLIRNTNHSAKGLRDWLHHLAGECMSIVEIIKQILSEKKMPQTIRQIHDEIVDRKLYVFHTKNSIGIINNQVRRHTCGIDIKSGSSKKYFKLVENNLFELATSQENKKKKLEHQSIKSDGIDKLSVTLRSLNSQHELYVSELKRKILNDLKRLTPAGFELFAKNLITIYGFQQTIVTQVSGDGGIDGHGKLKVGLANLSVAFQCKKYTKGNIQRPDIDKFRGAIQGEYEQGLFFTTASFSDGAIAVSIKRGAVPIILIDGITIVSMMLEKEFGVQNNIIIVPDYALDLALNNDL